MADTYAIPFDAITPSGIVANDIYLFADLSGSNAQITATFTVPASRKMRLPIPLLTQDVTAVVNSVSKTPRFNGDEPATTEVSFDLYDGVVLFNSANIGHTAVVTMYPEASLIPSNLIVYLQRVVELVKTVAGAPSIIVPVQFFGITSTAGSGRAKKIKLPVAAGTWALYAASATSDGQQAAGSGSTFRIATAYSGSPTDYMDVPIADTASESASAVTTFTGTRISRASGQDVVIWPEVAGKHVNPTVMMEFKRTA